MPSSESDVGTNRSADLVHCDGAVGDCHAVSAYIIEIRAVVLSGKGPVGYGVDDLGREFEVALDANLAIDIVAALDAGRRPIVAVERGQPIPPSSAAKRRPGTGAQPVVAPVP
jgi:hypothetical protein